MIRALVIATLLTVLAGCENYHSDYNLHKYIQSVEASLLRVHPDTVAMELLCAKLTKQTGTMWSVYYRSYYGKIFYGCTRMDNDMTKEEVEKFLSENEGK